MSPPSPVSFHLCADDYAMTPGVSRGIIEALDARALTATSVMTTSPWWPDTAAALTPYVGRASIGLHLNLTLGRPLRAMPRLAPSGRFPDIGTLMRRARTPGALPLDEIADEIDRQLDAFQAVLGRTPDHIDGHQHVHVLAPLRALLFDALGRRGWRPVLRDSGDRIERILRRGTTLPKALGVAWLARGYAAEATTAGLVTNDGFSGFSSFTISENYEASFASYLKAPGSRHLVMCHPGYVDDALRGLDPVVESRERELAFLLSSGFTQLLNRSRAVLAV